MKKGLFIFLVLFLTSTACSKWSKKMKIVRDCTGTYLQKDNKDYLVCNDEILASFEDGDKVKVEYDLLTDCFGLIEEPVCLMIHPYESLIEITEIK